MNKYLENIRSNNSSIEIEENGEIYKLTNPWNDKSISFHFAKNQRLSPIKDIQFPEELVAIYHSAQKTMEFIFIPIATGEVSKFTNEKTLFNFKGVQFQCYFDISSKALEILAKSFVKGDAESDSYYRNLPIFYDYYSKNELYKKFFREASPISYFVKGNFNKINCDFVTLFKTLNFYRFYFDRYCSQIIIIKKQIKTEKHEKPCYSKKQTFPSSINAKEIDPTILEIFSVARETKDIRLKFIFYYQILEFASYYYLNKKIQNKLSSILKKPEVSSMSNEYSKRIIEEMKDHFSSRDDSFKLETTITDYCTIDDIKLEIESNYEFFSKDINFEGGLFVPRILKNKEGIECLTDGDLIKVKTNIEKIRNVLVHLRESRENKVILPTETNNNLLVPYLYIVKRLAEKVAIQFE